MRKLRLAPNPALHVTSIIAYFVIRAIYLNVRQSIHYCRYILHVHLHYSDHLNVHPKYVCQVGHCRLDDPVVSQTVIQVD